MSTSDSAPLTTLCPWTTGLITSHLCFLVCKVSNNCSSLTAWLQKLTYSVPGMRHGGKALKTNPQGQLWMSNHSDPSLDSETPAPSKLNSEEVRQG